MAPHEQFAAEFRQLTKRTWWDSLIDGLNRLPRPVMVTLAIAYLISAWKDPATFAEINAGLATVPAEMWYLTSAIVGFYFAARELHHVRGKTSFRKAADAARELANITKPTLKPKPKAKPKPTPKPKAKPKPAAPLSGDEWNGG